MTLFSQIEPLPRDPIIGLTELFNKDQRQQIYNLGVGVYFDKTGKVPILESVRIAQKNLIEKDCPKTYLPMNGTANFCDNAKTLVLGEEISCVDSIFTVQTLGGTGALKLGAELLRRTDKVPLVAISDPSWENHRNIFESSGFKVVSYPYYDKKINNLCYSDLISTLGRLPSQSVVVLHASCHNPTGIDLTTEQWQEVLDLVNKRNLVPFFDLAYQGFKNSLENDRLVLEQFSKYNRPFLVASSFSKNFSLYGERVGALTTSVGAGEDKNKAYSHVKNLIRGLYSTPPTYGQAIVSEILSDNSIKNLWVSELGTMRERIVKMRALLSNLLEQYIPEKSFEQIRKQNGMFSYLGLSAEDAYSLRNDYGVYILESGRLCIAALNEGNIERVADAISKVLLKPN
jgi:aromatic-amino-acid transaminase